MNHSPANILSQLLQDGELLTKPEDGEDWPVYVASMPDGAGVEIDAAAVYINASTRFTDGFMFGFGAEIGISTQKLHARGPMGLKELTTSKYIVYGSGQVRT